VIPANSLLRTSTFRLVALYLGLFVLSTGAVLGYVYWNTAGLLARQTDETIQAEATGLAEQYRQGGLTQLVRIIAGRSREAGESIYLVTNFAGRKITGNISAMPANVPEGEGWVEFPYTITDADGKDAHEARAYLFRLAGGFSLLVGRDVEDRRYFVSLIRQALYWAVGLILVLGIAGGVLMSRNFLRRIDAIGTTSASIMRGDLSERMAVSGTGDELDRLAVSLNEMLDQIERLMNAMREVTDNVAHDLKTPLTRLRARLEDALRSGSEPIYREALERTIDEADQLLKTFNSLLSIARAEAGETRASMGRVDIAPMLADVAELYEPLVEEAGGAIAVDVQGDCRVTGDSQLLAQVVSNLLDNALKYGTIADGPPLHIAVTAARTGDRVEISVADNGPGIPEDQRARALERFVRLDTSRTRPGSGLGLSLVVGVARLHGGEFRLEDNAPGLRALLILPASNS
jgi:hypothetical protein